jgi:ornithine cyclodeaminase
LAPTSGPSHRPIVHLDAHRVGELLNADLSGRLVEATAEAFADLAVGRAATTVRVRARTADAMASAMAAAVPAMGVTGGKVYATIDGRFTFHMVLFDLDGRLLCTMDGGPLTEARTPALSHVVIDRLARPGSSVAAVLGTGREALPHLTMLARALDLDQVRVWGRRPEAAEALAATGRSQGIPARACPSSVEAVTDADVVVTVTSANEPVVAADAIADHALVCAAGATKPERCELDPALFARASAVITDSIEGAPTECGDLIHAVEAGTFRWHEVLDLADVLAGTARVRAPGSVSPGPVSPSDRVGPVIFETQGVAIQDVVAAALVWRAHIDR